MLDEERFVPIQTREEKSDIAADTWKHLAVSNAYAQKWRGIIHNKGPIEIALYQMLIYELSPRTIVELGALNGGGAIWMADICSLFGLNSKLISIDIDLNLVAPVAMNDGRVEFIEGDANKIESVLPAQRLRDLPHPWLIIEDCHVNTAGILDHFYDGGLEPGDYLIVEDTNQDAWDAWSDEWMDTDRVARGKRKLPTMTEWTASKSDMLVDRKYLDMYGYNSSKNWNSVLVKRRK